MPRTRGGASPGGRAWLLLLVSALAGGRRVVLAQCVDDPCVLPYPCVQGSVLPDPTDCSRYQRCVAPYEWVHVDCDQGSFSNVTCSCEEANQCHTWGCPIPPTPPNVQSEPCFTEDTVCANTRIRVPDRYFCSRYFECFQGVWRNMSCPESTPFYGDLPFPPPCFNDITKCDDIPFDDCLDAATDPPLISTTVRTVPTPTTVTANTTQPTTTQRPTTQPSTTQQPSTQPSTTQQPSTVPTTTEPTTTEPTTTEPTTTEPTTTEPTTTEPTTTQPTTTEPTTTEPTTTEQTTTEPTTTEPTTIVQTPTEQSTTEQSTTEQSTTEQITTEQTPTEQSTTEQSTTELDFTGHLTSDSSSSEPFSSKPPYITSDVSMVDTSTVVEMSTAFSRDDSTTDIIGYSASAHVSHEISSTLGVTTPNDAETKEYSASTMDGNLTSLAIDVTNSEAFSTDDVTVDHTSMMSLVNATGDYTTSLEMTNESLISTKISTVTDSTESIIMTEVSTSQEYGPSATTTQRSYVDASTSGVITASSGGPNSTTQNIVSGTSAHTPVTDSSTVTGTSQPYRTTEADRTGTRGSTTSGTTGADVTDITTTDYVILDTCDPLPSACDTPASTLAHATICTAFFECVNGQWTHQNCAGSTLYNPITGRCQRKFLVDCDVRCDGDGTGLAKMYRNIIIVTVSSVVGLVLVIIVVVFACRPQSEGYNLSDGASGISQGKHPYSSLANHGVPRVTRGSFSQDDVMMDLTSLDGGPSVDRGLQNHTFITDTGLNNHT